MAKRCACSVLYRAQHLRDTLRIPPRYENCTLERYVPKSLSQHHALKAVHRFAARFPGTSRGLFLSGPPGVGKTHLASGALLTLASRFYEGILFVDFPTILDHARRVGTTEAVAWFAEHEAAGARLVLLDDFGCVEASQENLRLAGVLLRCRMAPGRLNLFTGGPVYCRGVFGGPQKGRRSLTHEFIAGLPAEIRLQVLTGNRILAVNGEDFRQGTPGRDDLFD